jgi:hypothetical protein
MGLLTMQPQLNGNHGGYIAISSPSHILIPITDVFERGCLLILPVLAL